MTRVIADALVCFQNSYLTSFQHLQEEAPTAEQRSGDTGLRVSRL